MIGSLLKARTRPEKLRTSKFREVTIKKFRGIRLI